MHKRMRSHILCICSTFLCCVFLNACSKRLHKMMHVFGFSPLCIFKNVSLICSQKKMHCHIRCICSTFLCCVLLNVCSKRLHKRMQIHIGCICLTLTHCAFANVLSKHIHKKIFNYTRCICLTFLDCACRFVLLNV